MTLHFPKDSDKTLSSIRAFAPHCEAAGIGPGWGVLRSAPHRGIDRAALQAADKVVSLRWTNGCRPFGRNHGSYDNFKLVLNDVLKVDLKSLLQKNSATNRWPSVQSAVLHHQPHFDASAGRKTADSEHNRHGTKGGCTALCAGPVAGSRGHQLCRGLLCAA